MYFSGVYFAFHNYNKYKHNNKERVRFELTEQLRSSDFKSDAIDHSAIFPFFLDERTRTEKTICFYFISS